MVRVSPNERGAEIQRWLRPESGPAYRAATEWLLPRCRTEEERVLAPALLLLLAPLNALVAPCRPVAGSRVNFQVTLSRQTDAGPERVRLTVRTTAGQAAAPRTVSEPAANQQSACASTASEDRGVVVPLSESAVRSQPLVCAAAVLESLLRSGEQP